jgi:excisionase family DNA binding protein
VQGAGEFLAASCRYCQTVATTPDETEEFMAQKFTSLEDAAAQLKISKDLLGQLREAGKVRAYRDGASWKFRSEDIDKLADEGVPQLDPGASDLALDLDADLTGSSASAAKPGSDLSLAGDNDLSLEGAEVGAAPASDISLDDVDEPTVTGLDDEGSDNALSLDDDEIDLSKDSILMSENELGAMGGRPPSTIIGRAELDLDADLDLSPLEKGGAVSDVKLAAGESDLLPAPDDDLALDLPSASGDFEGLDELEVDLEAESSRILSPEDVAKAQAAAKSSGKGKGKATGLSDLGLAPASDLDLEMSGVNIGGESAVSGGGLTGLSALELDDEDDQVLGESSGSDVTLSGQSSGINIISPSDSGLALDEVPLDLSGSAPIGSSLDLGSISSDDVTMEPLALGSGVSQIGSGIGGDFQLTPLGEEDSDDEKDSSQVIALDELTEEAGGSPLGGGLEDSGMMGEDFGAGLTPGAMPIGAVAAQELPFSVWNVLGLVGCMLFLLLCGAMTFDLLRNMWSWGGVTSINSSLLEVLNPFLGR